VQSWTLSAKAKAKNLTARSSVDGGLAPPARKSAPRSRMAGALHAIKIIKGTAAWAWLTAAKNAEAWHYLAETCTWATAYQTPQFCITWYEVYATKWTPVLVVSSDSRTSLRGLLPLAIDRTGTLAVAGAYLAEYQAWLSDPNDGGQYIAAALDAVAAEFPGARLDFKYLPSSTPLDALVSSPLAGRVGLTPHRRPLMRIVPEDIAASFKKKGNKSRFSRLARLGELKFERIGGSSEFETLLDRIMPMYDFRQAATHLASPFADDPMRKAFLVRLMERHSDLIHVTAYSLNQVPFAVHIGTLSQARRELHLDIIAQSPLLAEHSPGKLLIMQLARHLLAEGIQAFDLTPGEDPWKARFADNDDEVYQATIFSSRADYRRCKIISGSVGAAKRIAGIFGVEPADVRWALAQARRASVGGLVASVQRSLRKKEEFQIYRKALPASVSMLSNGLVPRRDSFDDLLKFKRCGSWLTRDQFMSRALERLEAGSHVYTIADRDELLHYGWLMPNHPKAVPIGVGCEYFYPENTAALYDFHTVPSARDRGLYEANIRRMLSDLSQGKAAFAYVSISSDDASARRIVEKLGFAYVESAGRVRPWGRGGRGISPPAKGGAA
jgi:CelD/BcsL family acetyltransferase involved in cellulose biosynthesis